MSPQKHVLVIDDDEALRSALDAKFRKRGYRVTLVEDGDKAMDVLNEHAFNAVLLDLKLPGRDGFSVLREMKNTKNPTTPVYVITNLGTDSNCEIVMSLGAKKCYVKSLITLKEVVEEISAEIS